MENPPNAKFQITNTFKITGRGLVLSGYILEGLISTGDAIEFEVNGKVFKLRIKAIEGICMSPPSVVNTGLVVECENLTEIDILCKWNPENVVAGVYSETGLSNINP